MDSVTRWAIGLLAIAAAASAGEPPKPPWEPSYKIKPEERHRLTAADVVGPDGIVYPDWRYAGVPSGIPDVPDLARVEAVGGKADDDRDDSAAVEKGAQAVAQRGGGALVLGKGTYHLDRTCSFDHIIRGNAFALAKASQPAIHLATADCVGVDLLGNRVYGGNGKLVVGSGQPLAAKGNAFAPYAADAPRPSHRVPSIFEWQRRRVR